MPRAIPLGPLIFALSGLGLIGLSAYLLLSKDTPSVGSEAVAEETITPAGEVTLLTYHDPMRARGYVEIVLRQSPFIADRSAYSRDAPSVQAAAKPELNPEFVGTVGRDEAMSALVIWKPGQAAQTHSIGDETPWGVLISSTPTNLVFEGEGGRKELDLF